MSWLQRFLDALGLRGASRQPTPRSSVEKAYLDGFLKARGDSKKTLLRVLREQRAPSRLPEALELLQDPESTVREEAMLTVGWLGRGRPEAVEAALRALQDPAPLVRQRAASALAPGALDPPPEQALPALIARHDEEPEGSVRRELVSILSHHLRDPLRPLLPVVARVFEQALRDPEVAVRRQAAYSLGSNHRFFTGAPGKSDGVIQALRKGLTDPDEEVRRRCAVSLSHHEPGAIDALPVLREMLRNPAHEHVVSDAAEALKRLHGDEPRALLQTLLGGADPAQRARAAFALLPDRLPLDAFAQIVAAIPSLSAAEIKEQLWLLAGVELSAEQQALVRPLALAQASPANPACSEALRLLARVGVNQPDVRNFLLNFLQHSPSRYTGDAVEALGRVCKDPAPVLPTLRRLLRSSEASVRRDTARVVGWYGEGGKVAVGELLEALEQAPDTYSRTTILSALGGIGPGAREAVPAALAWLASGTGSEQEEAARVLAQVRAGSLLLRGSAPGLVLGGLKSGSLALKNQLLRAVASCGEEGAMFAEAAGALLGEPTYPTRQYAIEALEGLGVGASGALPWVLEVLPAVEDGQRLRLLRLLVRQPRPLGDPAAEGLLRLVRGLAPEQTRRVMTELIALGPDATLALLEASQSEEEALCIAASRALEQQGEALLPALERALEHPDAGLRMRAVGALGALGKVAHEALRRALRHPDEQVQLQAEIALP
jgi:HEAT repeat protein